MARYRSRPVEIEAFCWTGDRDQAEDPDWICEAIRLGRVQFVDGRADVVMRIETPTGTRQAERGDWIIRGVEGEIYSCRPSVFVETYEAWPR